VITFDSVGHFFATAWHDTCLAARVVANHNQQIQQAGFKVEEITGALALVPGVGAFAIPAEEIERVSMFSLGIVCQLILAHGSAQAASLKYPDVAESLFTQAEQLMTQYPQIVAQARSLTK
jgi:hypothetical protein